MEKEPSYMEPEWPLRELGYKNEEISRLKLMNEKLESILTEGLKTGEEDGQEQLSAVTWLKSRIKWLKSQVKWLNSILEFERRDHLNALQLSKEVTKLRKRVADLAANLRQMAVDSVTRYDVLLEEKQQTIDELIKAHNVVVKQLEEAQKSSARLVPVTPEVIKKSKRREQIDRAHYAYLKNEVASLRRRLGHIQSAKPIIDEQVKLLLDENAQKNRYIAYLQETLDILKENETAQAEHGYQGRDYFLGVEAQREINRMARLLNKKISQPKVGSIKGVDIMHDDCEEPLED